MLAEATTRQDDDLWFRAGNWLIEAFRRTNAARDELTPMQALNVKRIICIFEAALRRLILLSALALELEYTPPRKRRTAPHDTSVRRSGKRRTPIRLYASGQHASNTHAHTAAPTHPNANHPQAARKARFGIGQSDCLTHRSAHTRATHARHARGEARGACYTAQQIDEPCPDRLPPELQLTLCAAKPTSAPAAQHAAPAATKPAAPPPPITKQQMLDYLGELHMLFWDPSRAILRAARALARSRAAREHIARAQFISPKGAMRFSVREIARNVIPLHRELRRVCAERLHDTS